jgi:hypothetical protein
MAYFVDSYIKKICEITMREMMNRIEGSIILARQQSRGVCGTPRPFWCSNPIDTSEAEDNETGDTRQYPIRD